MNQIMVQLFHGKTLCLSFSQPCLVRDIKSIIQDREGIPSSFQRLSTSRNVNDQEYVSNAFLILSLSLVGGKGGFGALLRGSGGQKTGSKKTGTDDCRDLNGRRVRQVKQEQKITEWHQKQKERESKEEEEKKKAKEAKEAKNAQYQFDNARFAQESREITENIALSVQKGLEEAKKKVKKTVEVHPLHQLAKNPLWNDLENSDSEENTKEKGEPQPQVASTTTTISTHYEEIETTSKTINLDDYSSVEELEKIGLDELKKELQNRGLLCGGTLRERAERFFSIKGKQISEIDPSLFAKPNKKRKKSTKEVSLNKKAKLEVETK